MSPKLVNMVSIVRKKCIYFVVDRAAVIRFFFHTIFKPSEFILKKYGDSFWLRKNTSDTFVLKEVYEKKVYGVRPIGVVLDIGANIGAFSVYAGSTADVVYAFEPVSSNYAQLVKNIQLNNKEDKIKPIKLAVGSEDKEVCIYKGRFNKGASSVINKITADSEVVEMRNLSNLIAELGIHKVNLLKIDIEGSEYSLLYGLPKKTFEIIDKIVLEYHFVDSESYVSLEKYLISLGYTTRKHKGSSVLIGTGTLEAVKKTIN